jgi:flagellin
VLGGTTFNGKAVLAQAAGTSDLPGRRQHHRQRRDRHFTTADDLSIDARITVVAGTDNAGSGRAGIGGSHQRRRPGGAVINNIDVAFDFINGERATLGAQQNRFDAVISNLQISHENQMAARSRIMDADYAMETSAT